MLHFDVRRAGIALAVAIPLLALATLVVGVLHDSFGVPNPSAVYLIAVVGAAFVGGPIEAIAVAIASSLIYNFLFTAPRYTFMISDPGVWLSVLVLLFVGIVVGQLAALQRSRADVARAREREARTLFKVSRALATRVSTAAVMPGIATDLRSEARMQRVWIALGADEAGERVAADSGGGVTLAMPGLHHVLQRMPGDEPARWVRIHQPGVGRLVGGGVNAYRVRIEAGGAPFGSLWAVRETGRGEPDRTETRLLGAAADQIGQVLRQDGLAAQSQAAEIARQSDALKSALLQSVSHDLRTPLATIRAAAGTLRPGSTLSLEDQHASAAAIDREAEYLNRLVTNLLDLSRIEAGALRAELDVFELDDLVLAIIDRLRPRLGDRPIHLDLVAPPIEVDPTFFEQAVTNVLENAIKFSPDRTPITALAVSHDGFVRLTIEDAGTGVPQEALPRLFERFYRVPGHDRSSRSGTGIGLTVVRGLVEAMGGRVDARRSEAGGLAVDMDLPMARIPSGSE